MLGTLVATAVLAAAPHGHHRPGCNTLRCDRWADAQVVEEAKRRRHLREVREARERPRLSAHAVCIIEHESGGNPQAVNGIYSGVGQWEESRWLSDGGGRYSSTPLGATLFEQERVLMAEGDAGMSQQQGQYDGCG